MTLPSWLQPVVQVNTDLVSQGPERVFAAHTCHSVCSSCSTAFTKDSEPSHGFWTFYTEFAPENQVYSQIWNRELALRKDYVISNFRANLRGFGTVMRRYKLRTVHRSRWRHNSRHLERTKDKNSARASPATAWISNSFLRRFMQISKSQSMTFHLIQMVFPLTRRCSQGESDDDIHYLRRF